MAQIENIERVIATLKRLAAKHEGKVSVVVGYQTAYALYVHENLEMKLRGQPRKAPAKGNYWDPPGRGQSKYLEQPAREGAARIAEIVRLAVKAGKTIGDGLLMAGLWLQRQSQMLVPIDTGVLRNSAFTTKETT